MRNKTIALGLVAALTFGAAGAQAQAPQRDSARAKAGQQDGKGPRGERGMRGMRGERGGPDGFLLRGITLTDAQKQQVQQLRERERTAMQAQRESMRGTMEQAREARQRGDTAAARAQMRAMRTVMEAQRERHVASLRGILTADQRTQLDKNLAEVKQRQAERGERGMKGQHGKHGKQGKRGSGTQGARRGA
jgi:Spy/CpxP family protein refolding chaperone